jgi:hypothetical protein
MRTTIVVFGLALVSLGASFAIVAAFPEYDAKMLASVVHAPLGADSVLLRPAD